VTPERMARDAVRVVDRLERAQLQRVRELMRAVERDLASLLPGLATRDTSTSRVLTEYRVRLALEQSRAAQRLLDLGSSSGPLASAYRDGVTLAYADGVRTARAAALDRGFGLIDRATLDAVTAFGPRADLDFITAVTDSTLTRLQKVSALALPRLEEAIVTGAVRGSGPRATARLAREALDLTRYEAERITRTVFARANAEARAETFRELRVELVQYDATNDDRTCDYCGSRHGLVYKIEDAPEVPLHPMCRCVLLPWREDVPERSRGDEYYLETRAELDPEKSWRARAPFEKADGRDAPAPVWAPGRGYL
jgi:SPP1 gp7 family putative phage head morphogenesis protein